MGYLREGATADLYLIGDSILDNGAYTEDGTGTMDMIAAALGALTVEKLARDGAMLADTVDQTAVDDGANLRVFSAGGNDLLDALPDLVTHQGPPLQYLAALTGTRQSFVDAYDAATGQAFGGGRTLVLTVWPSRFADFESPLPIPVDGAIVDRAASMAVGIFNDEIWRLAQRKGYDVLDIARLNKAHYANAIEPSLAGSRVICASVVDWVRRRRDRQSESG